MEEKILIQSKHYNVKKFTIIVIVLSIIVSICMLSYITIDSYAYYSSKYHQEEWEPQWLCRHTKSDYVTYKKGTKTYKDVIKAEAQTREEFEKIHPNVMSYIKCCRNGHGLLYIADVIISMLPLAAILIVLIFYMWLSSYSLTVTDKRVYGKAAFGKRIDLPFDKVSAVGTSFLKGIVVGTSSGRIKFKLVKNQDEIHSVISKLLMERQQAEKTNNTPNNEKSSSADELKKYKDLLDGGIITQEEFEQKKKQILDL